MTDEIGVVIVTITGVLIYGVILLGLVLSYFEYRSEQKRMKK